MRFGVAIFLSILFHAALAAALAVYVEYAPTPDALAQLDLSSVDLSFAETEDETAAVQPALASTPEEPVPDEPSPPPAPERPPESEPPKELPPELDALKLPDPAPERPPLKTPVVEPPKEEPRKEPPRPPVTASAPAPAVAPRQARVDAPPRPRKSIKPDYPKGARLRGEQGDVQLEIEVTASGAVGEVKVVSSSGYPELDEAAVRAVKAAHFTPAKRGRQSVASTAKITLTFKLK